jgi:hypothetical protein
MILKRKLMAVIAALLLTIGFVISCKHEAGNICEGKNIGINDSILTYNIPNQQILDSNLNFTGQYYLVMNGVITGLGIDPFTCYLVDSATKVRTSYSLKLNDTINNLDSGTYYINVVDAQSCSSPTYTFRVPQ